MIHQHDHPIAGPHYDLRLQFSDTSSVSWSVMYGVPGDPNGGRRVNRNAIETRVHCLWVRLSSSILVLFLHGNDVVYRIISLKLPLRTQGV